MYRGFINEIGEVVESSSDRLWVRAPEAAEAVLEGGSVALAGVCLSAEARDGDRIRICVSPETRRRTTLDGLSAGDRLNVETPLRSGESLEGHLVQGHVDGVGKVVKVADEGDCRRLWIRPPERMMGELVSKGSVAVDGVSVTVAEVVRDRFCVSLIPSTLTRTTLAKLDVGDRVNLESDMVGRLARRHGAGASGALARVVARLPWAGQIAGSTGVEKAVQQIAAGGVVVVWDPDREGEGDVVVSARDLAPATMTFILTQACSHPTVPCAVDVLDRLEIPLIPGDGDRHGTAMHVPVDLREASGTGVSPAERAATIRRLASPDARPSDFLRPGHVFPLGARNGGLRERAGHTEATVELMRAAGLPPVGVCCEIMAPNGEMADAAELERFALDWGLPLIDIRELVAHL